MHIGKNISQIRELLGISQKQFAKSLKVSKPTVVHIEHKEVLSDKAIRRTAKALNVPKKLITTFDERIIFRYYLDNFPVERNEISPLS
jgi:transcriptional regulator with XRE-family HTH domain